MTGQALWLPGDFPTTNKLLDLARASGYYQGTQVAERRRPRRNEQDVNVTLANIRGDTKMRALGARLRPCPADVRVPLLFVHLGSGRRDPSSWYLSAKAIEDGLVDAGVLGSDRFNVAMTAGFCVKATDQRWRDEIERRCHLDTGGVSGMFVLVGVPDGLTLF